MFKPLFCALLTLALVISCEKSTRSNSQPKSPAVENFLKIGEQIEERMAFSLMTQNEQEELVSLHLDFCLQYFDLSADQIETLEYAKDNLHTMFSSSNIETNAEMQALESKINSYFYTLNETSQQLIFDSMVTSEEEIAGIETGSGSNAPSDCNCSRTSDWCTGPGSCSGPCTHQSRRGCGTLWGYACKAKCTLFS